jgi:DNA-binding NtrC family response regulator
MEFLRRFKDKWPDTEVVVMTAYGSIDTAVEARRCGAYDYITKPIDRERFPIVALADHVIEARPGLEAISELLVLGG